MAGPSCASGDGLPDAVFTVTLAAGETLVVREPERSNVNINILGDCDPAAACLAATSAGCTEVRYQATAAETVTVVVESADAFATPYRLRFDLASPEVCDDGLDNDIDGGVDCGDPECFGVGSCSVELLCDDDLDNDADALIDCADDDSAPLPDCDPIPGLWESFSPQTSFDLSEYMVRCTPDPAMDFGYGWSALPAAAFVEAPGTGEPSTVLVLVLYDIGVIELVWLVADLDATGEALVGISSGGVGAVPSLELDLLP